MIVIEFRNHDTIALTYTYLTIGSIDQSITTTVYLTTRVSMTACANMVIRSFFECQNLALTRSLGLDDLLSKHISHLFIRDPLVIFSETIDQDDASSSDHFEVCLCAVCRGHHDLSPLAEHTVDKLANSAFQAATTKFVHWLARRVSQHGGANDGF
jgi:Glutamate-cysteine ligase